jgi:nucleoside-diphosphate-sugar epimerase
VYGPGDPQRRLWSYVKRMDDGRPIILLDEALAQWRWTRGYVEEVARAIVLTVLDDGAAGRVFNIGEAEALSEAEWIRAIGQTANWKGHVVAVPTVRLPQSLKRQQFIQLNYAQQLIIDTSRLRGTLGYRETIDRHEALHRAVAWQRANPPETVDPGEFDYAGEDEAARF